MGCLTSKDASSSSKKSNDKKKGKEKGAEKGGYSWDKQREGINPDDFVVRKLNGQVVVKEPGYTFSLISLIFIMSKTLIKDI